MRYPQCFRKDQGCPVLVRRPDIQELQDQETPVQGHDEILQVRHRHPALLHLRLMLRLLRLLMTQVMLFGDWFGFGLESKGKLTEPGASAS